jgi:hypothetical protein
MQCEQAAFAMHASASQIGSLWCICSKVGFEPTLTTMCLLTFAIPKTYSTMYMRRALPSARMWSFIQSVVLKQVMGMPISFNGNLAGHLGLGQHCDVNVMQPISRIIVGNGLIAAATTCVKSVAAKSLVLSTPTSCQYGNTEEDMQ